MKKVTHQYHVKKVKTKKKVQKKSETTLDREIYAWHTMPIFGTVTERDFQKSPKHRSIPQLQRHRYINWCNASLWIFLEKRVRQPNLYFPGFADKVKTQPSGEYRNWSHYFVGSLLNWIMTWHIYGQINLWNMKLLKYRVTFGHTYRYIGQSAWNSLSRKTRAEPR